MKGKRIFSITVILLLGLVGLLLYREATIDAGLDTIIDKKHNEQAKLDSYYEEDIDSGRYEVGEKSTERIDSETEGSTEDTITERQTNNDINETIDINTDRANPFTDYFEANEDYVGWISIEDTKVDYPIVKGMDNDFYLDHGFDKSYQVAGSIYMDYRNFGQGYDDHTIIYGHNMKDGSMFGDLDGYMNQTYLDNHPTIVIEGLYEKKLYQVFSVYYESADTARLDVNLSQDYMKYILDKSITSSDIGYGSELVTNIDSDSDSDYMDQVKLLTLVTCSYEVDNGRYFIHAIEIERESL
jgi:SrtB family sortase